MIVEQIIRPTGLIDPAIKVIPTKGQMDSLISEINLIGRVSMDLITLDLSKFQKKDVQIYNRIEIINDQNNINRICENIGTIPYEILTNLGHRYSRKYK